MPTLKHAYRNARAHAHTRLHTHPQLELAATLWLYPVIGYMPYNEAATAKAKGDVKVALDTLEVCIHTHSGACTHTRTHRHTCATRSTLSATELPLPETSTHTHTHAGTPV